jgi:hypothetical protein
MKNKYAIYESVNIDTSQSVYYTLALHYQELSGKDLIALYTNLALFLSSVIKIYICCVQNCFLEQIWPLTTKQNY